MMKIELKGFLVKKKMNVQGAHKRAWVTIEEVSTLAQAQLFVAHESGKFKFVPQYRRV